jgi:predicted transcriptional regulator
MLYIKENQQKTKEYQFLNDFLQVNFFSNYVNNKELGCIFIREPFTGLGYTDLVVIIWNKDIANNWHSDRNKLIIDDIKIMHHLYLSKRYKSISEIMKELGFSEKKILESLTRLNNAGLLKCNKDNKFKTLKKSEIFHVKEIISIEAKLKNWRRALEQAFVNSYYASESYILFPKESITKQMLETYKKTDIGIISFNKDMDVIKKAKKNVIPSNLNSWLFNEYVGRTL